MKNKKLRKYQKGGFVGGLCKRIVNATGGVKMKDGTKRKFNLKFSPYRKKEPLFLPKQKGGKRKQKGGSAMPDYTYTNRHGWRSWGSHWYPSQMGGWTKEWVNYKRQGGWGRGKQKGGGRKKQKGGWLNHDLYKF